jgi:hypothetical protein
MATSYMTQVRKERWRMTPQEAIISIQKHNEVHSKKERFAVHITEALQMAVESLRKQIPEKPIRANRIVPKRGNLYYINDDNEYWKCPKCIRYDVQLLEKQEYCHFCGQALDWGEYNG